MKLRKIIPIIICPIVALPTFMVMSCSKTESKDENDGEQEKPIDYKLDIIGQQESYEIDTEHTLSISSITPSINNVRYSWTTSNNNLIIVSGQNTNSITFKSNVVGSYFLKLEISNEENKILKSETIEVKFVSSQVEKVNAKIISDDNFEFNEMGIYFVSVELDKQIDGVSFEWTLPNFIVTPQSPLNEETISFQVNMEQEFDISVKVLKDGKEIASASHRVTFNSSSSTYDVVFNGQNQKFYVNNEYEISANLSPSLPNAFFDWQSNSNNLNLSSISSNTISINPSMSGNYRITLNVYNDASKSKLLVSKYIDINVNDYEIEINPDSSYDINRSYSLTANVIPNDSTYTYRWSCSDQDLKITNANSKTVSFITSVAKTYTLIFEVLKSSNVLVSETIQITFV